jgi:hypothetical protein
MFPLPGERVRVRGLNKISFDTLQLAAGRFISLIFRSSKTKTFKPEIGKRK